jgi:hypothetical protein
MWWGETADRQIWMKAIYARFFLQAQTAYLGIENREYHL